jgi:hypothetical protein
MRAIIISIQSLDFSIMINRKSISPNVEIRYPNQDKKIVYANRGIRSKMALPQLTPLNGFVILPSTLFFKILVVKRIMAKTPKATPAHKGRNPGPGFLKLPMWARIDSTQTIIEITNQKRPPN